MSIEPNDLLLFARIVEYGSFSLTAERIGWPKSTVSRRLALLEQQLGERLLQRTTRKLQVTEFGRSVLDHARNVAEQVAATDALAQHRQLAPSGRLRVSMPADFASHTMLPSMAEFIERYPGITLELDLSARRVDLIAENFDLALRIGSLPDDSSLVARALMHVTPGLYAAPAYIARRGLPTHPDDLLQHELLVLINRQGDPVHAALHRGPERWQRELPARVLANSPEVLMRLAMAGGGIAAGSGQIADPWVQSGELVRVLPDWHLPETTVWAVFPGRRLMPAKTRAFLDWIHQWFAKA